MNLHELQNEISTVISMDLNTEQLRTSYEDLAERYVADKAELLALEEALENCSNKSVAKEVADAADKILEEYANRYITPEMEEKLDDLGFSFPFVLLSKEEAEDVMSLDLPVMLLYNEDRFKTAESWEEVEAHLKNGGTIATDQFSIDELKRSVFMDNEEYEP